MRDATRGVASGGSPEEKSYFIVFAVGFGALPRSNLLHSQVSNILPKGSAVTIELLLFIRDLARGVAPGGSSEEFVRYRCRGTATQQSYFILFAVGFGALPRANLLRL